MKGHIPAVMQSIFDAPGTTHDLQQSFGAGFLTGQTGQTKAHLLVHFSGGQISEAPFQLEHLSYARLIQVVLEQTADRDGAFYQASMSFVYRSGLLEIHRRASQTGDGHFGGK